MSLTSYIVGKSGLVESPFDEADPRGQLLVWEHPQPWAEYVIGCDPTMGIVGWNRQMRSAEEEKHDNAAIEVFRRGRMGKDGQRGQDIQVAEWAGPVDAEDLAEVCNFIGRLYGGCHEDGQALMCIEVYPGTGWMTQRVLISKYGYTHLPPWLVEGKGFVQRDTGQFGWKSNVHTRRDLWTRGANHLNRRRVVINSPFFVEEMVDCTPDNFLAVTARALGGRHDDRVVAGLIGLWFCNEWAIGQEPTDNEPLQDQEAPEWQACDISAQGMVEAWNARVAELGGDD